MQEMILNGIVTAFAVTVLGCQVYLQSLDPLDLLIPILASVTLDTVVNDR